VAGLRVAVRQARWDVDDFDAAYAYLSSHAHGGLSFVRTNDHGVDFRKPTGAQYAISGIALEYAERALKHGTAITQRNFL
jgi:hypothetical protein